MGWTLTVAFGEFEEVYEDHCITSLYIVGKGKDIDTQAFANGCKGYF
jgi:hypothetical protein